jgi:hypothetical protein
VFADFLLLEKLLPRDRELVGKLGQQQVALLELGTARHGSDGAWT